MLSPYRVLDLTDNGSLLCGQILADLGADVVVVEPPGGAAARRSGPFADDQPGPETSLNWWALSRNKRSLTLDLEAEEGRASLRRLAEGADILVESFAPGYLEGLGLGFEALSKGNPGLVMVSVTPFGQSGPKAGWAASDLTALASSGALGLTGDEDRAPVHCAVPQAFLHAGAEAAVAALVGLAARSRDGLGQHIDVSAQAATMMATQSFVLVPAWDMGSLIERVGGGLRLGPLKLRFVYPCKDGHVNITLLFGTALGPFTRRLFEWIYEEGFCDAATRDKDWEGYYVLLGSGEERVSELERITGCVEAFAAARTKAELFEGTFRRHVLIVPVSTTEDVVQSAQLGARKFWQPVTLSDGREVRFQGPFAKFSETPIEYRLPPPRLGEHSQTILAGGPRARTEMAPVPQGGSDLAPLAGLKVLDFTWAYAGPGGTRYLADYGATVVKVETAVRIDALRTGQPFKDGVAGPERSGNYANANAGKLGLTLNLAVPEAREVALRLSGWADVVVENFSPKAMRGWGLHYEALREVNPEVIMLSTCLSGATGPHASLAGFGTMGASLAGFHELTGWPDRAPAGPFLAYTDYVSPKFVAAAVLAAVDHRRRTGQGQFIDLSQGECSLHFIGPALLDFTVNRRVQSRTGNASTRYAPHGVYPAAGEDRWIAIVVTGEIEWSALCDVAGRSAWRTDERFGTLPARLANREALDAALSEWTSGLEVEVLEGVLQGAGVAAHRVSTCAELLDDPQLIHRSHFVTAEHPVVGPVVLEGPRFRLSRSPVPAPAAGPTLGQHNEYVLRDLLGLSEAEVAELAAAGALE